MNAEISEDKLTTVITPLSGKRCHCVNMEANPLRVLSLLGSYFSDWFTPEEACEVFKNLKPDDVIALCDSTAVLGFFIGSWNENTGWRFKRKFLFV